MAQMNLEDRYIRLRPPPATPSDEICACRQEIPLKLSPALSYNPIHCVACNGEVPLEPLDLSVRLVDDIASWRSVAGSLERLWLDSGDYEAWAVEELSNIDSYVNRRGLAVCRSLDRIRRCYYLYHEEGARPACPKCGTTPAERTYGQFVYQVCDVCSILWHSK